MTIDSHLHLIQKIIIFIPVNQTTEFKGTCLKSTASMTSPTNHSSSIFCSIQYCTQINTS